MLNTNLQLQRCRDIEHIFNVRQEEQLKLQHQVKQQQKSLLQIDEKLQLLDKELSTSEGTNQINVVRFVAKRDLESLKAIRGELRTNELAQTMPEDVSQRIISNLQRSHAGVHGMSKDLIWVDGTILIA